MNSVFRLCTLVSLEFYCLVRHLNSFASGQKLDLLSAFFTRPCISADGARILSDDLTFMTWHGAGSSHESDQNQAFYVRRAVGTCLNKGMCAYCSVCMMFSIMLVLVLLLN